jgi:hypothetical protein
LPRIIHRTMAHAYARQHRGDATAYASYFAGMDASMQQKVAYTTAHFPSSGVVADMGSGSGLGTFQLARLHPGLRLVGVDINPVSVAAARETYRLPNLEYREGDIGARLFEDGSLDGILNSSVLHHVTSFNGFSVEPVRAALAAQVAQLKAGGVVVVRDFVIGRGPELVVLHLREDDGQPEGAPHSLSTAALFERFCATWRSSVNPDWPVPYHRLPPREPGRARFKVARRAAAEFLLRKDYRDAWEAELLEEYTYFSQADFEAEFRRLGLRIVLSQEVHNPWIVERRFRGQAALESLSGTALPFPPTNYVIVGERVAGHHGVHLREAVPRALPAPTYLGLDVFVHAHTGKRYELVHRPHRTVDVVPWFERDGRLWVVARQGFPRPVLNALARSPALSGASVAGFITEPLTVLLEGDPTEAAVRRILEERAGLSEAEVLEVAKPQRLFPSPGGLNECVTAFPVQVTPTFVRRESPNLSPFSTSGALRELDAQQLLRAAQVGGLFDARLECHVYALLRDVGQPLEPWIGAEVRLGEGPALPSVPAAQVLSPAASAPWTRLPPGQAARFLAVREALFVEEDAHAETVATGRFEYVVPRTLAPSTVSTLPVVRRGAEVLVGLELRELPAVQEFTGGATLATCPAWRLPREVTTLDAAHAFALERLEKDFDVRPGRAWDLGGRYFPTPGVTPEVVYPLLIEARTGGRLQWVRLSELLALHERVLDGHLRVALFRLAHALG